MIVSLIDYLRDRLPTVIKICYFVLASLVLIDIFVDKHHAHTWIEHIPGFWSVFGFVACVAIIIISKWFGHQGIMTREDYYDD
jgi:hypothetical protein